MKTPRATGSPAFRFVLTMGVVNLFADITYDGGGAILPSPLAAVSSRTCSSDVPATDSGSRSC